MRSRVHARLLVALALGSLPAGHAACSTGGSSLADKGDDPPAGNVADAAAEDAGQGGKGGANGKDAFPEVGPDGEYDALGDTALPDVAPDVFVEPDGAPELRFLHGVADATAVRVCLLPWSGAAPLPGAPVPLGTTDIAYGGSLLLTAPVGAVPEGAFRPVVVGGDLAKANGLDCATVLSQPPAGVRVAGLPVLPAGTLTAPRSLLLVATGCLGGVALPDPGAACGQGLPPLAANPSAVVVTLSRAAPPASALGLQVVHASATSPELALRIVPDKAEGGVVVTSQVAFGGIEPRPPRQLDPALLGVVPTAATLALADTQGNALFTQLLGDALATSGQAESALAAGKGLVLVVVGPRPSTVDAAVANGPRVVVLAAPK